MNFQRVTLMEGKCPLDYMAEQDKKVESAWIFLSKSAVKRMESTAGTKTVDGSILMLSWKETADYPASSITLRARRLTNENEWYELVKCEAEDIAFKAPANNPRDIFFITTWDVE